MKGKSGNKMALIGCGWLGQAVAQRLIEKHIAVVGTTRSAQRANTLREQGIEPVILDVAALSAANTQALADSPCWMINIPPGRRRIDASVFTEQLCRLIDVAQAQDIQQIIFISTTSVYGESPYTEVSEIKENAPTYPETGSAHAHVAIEQYLRETLPGRHCVLRLAGLVDDQRHPVTSLSGRSQISAPQKPVNLVHKVDVVNAVLAIQQKCIVDDVLHLSATDHPPRKAYYQWAADEKGLQRPDFIKDDKPIGKVIDPQYTLQKLGLTLAYASPYDMLR
ncbi:NAD(P)H-binding protein [Alteromonas oceanisediminis]|uniref:NAD(P)H-binding protein n=1 Tax=Alteromonas oceanisediminis TaxID=2836180 RepID=UPI001BDAA2C3|nr:NAD(P)H-binding protein [Alteromonas oceanisediminis]MBT0585875.1 NAD(P)H-binding protein [Alteromonas oceanisediminis]